jgi:serine/threonine protein kinase
MTPDRPDSGRRAQGRPPPGDRPPTPVTKASAGSSTDAGTGPRPSAPDGQAVVPPELTNHPEYEVIRELGRGGMGVVYLARNKRMFGRVEVLKVAAPGQKSRTEAADRFVKEMWASAQLAHENVVRAITTLRDEKDGSTFALALEYAGEEDLARVVKKTGPLTPARASRLVAQAAQGLQAAHEKGMVHRDIKPSNLMLGVQGKREVVKILDFGLVKAAYGPAADADLGGAWSVGADLQLTGAGRVLGTPDYVAPEQSKDASAVDIRADIYSLGCTLYFLLAGWPPYRPPGGPSHSVQALILAHHFDAPTPITEVRADVPAGLAAVVARMMAKNPADRFAAPEEVVRALLPFTKPSPVPAPAKPKDEPAPPLVAAENVVPEVTTIPRPPEPQPKADPERVSPGRLIPIGIGLFAVPFVTVLGVMTWLRDPPPPSSVAATTVTMPPASVPPPQETPATKPESTAPATKPEEPPPSQIARPVPRSAPPTRVAAVVTKPDSPVPPPTRPTPPKTPPPPAYKDLLFTPDSRAGWDVAGKTDVQRGLVLKKGAELLSKERFLIEELVVSGELSAAKDTYAQIGIHLYPVEKANPMAGWADRWRGISAPIRPKSTTAVRLIDPGPAFDPKPASRVGDAAPTEFAALARQLYKFEYRWVRDDQRGMFLIQSTLPANGQIKAVRNVFAYKVNNSDDGGHVGLLVSEGELTVTKLAVRGKPGRP